MKIQILCKINLIRSRKRCALAFTVAGSVANLMGGGKPLIIVHAVERRMQRNAIWKWFLKYLSRKLRSYSYYFYWNLIWHLLISKNCAKKIFLFILKSYVVKKRSYSCGLVPWIFSIRIKCENFWNTFSLNHLKLSLKEILTHKTHKNLLKLKQANLIMP